MLVRAHRAVGRALLRLPRLGGAVLTAVWAVTIYLLSDSSNPLPVAPPVPLFVNNMAHAPLFGFLCFLALVAAPRRMEPFPWPRIDRRTCTWILAAVLCYALFDEWHQSWVPGRDSSLGDVLTDLTGACSVLWVASGLGRPSFRTRSLVIRLVLCLAACASAAAIATWAMPAPQPR
ncbi:VanZ like family protein [Planctomycetes bacterium Pla86]|uniref:VanZ like family protein n=1 Tax=Engelhardtia mirabilis TaxID=2528011 RepID=A0A518BH73_9BACT|nr:VanZ like family protein [Planctomycetes bacterium Pla133]QDV00630.1 VanZ like family protein [Planctomycetes bacterium Pla86]